MYKERLKNMRIEHNLTQENIAKIIGIVGDRYGQYEREYELIPIKHLSTLCDYFNVSIDYIFNLTNDLSYPTSRKKINKIISGERLKNLRKNNNYTQEKFAKLWNLRDTTISSYEKGKNIISTPFLYFVCQKYNVSADYLLGRIDEPKFITKIK